MSRSATGPATATLTQFVLKIHSRCDLACDYCYVYRHADQSWRRRPPTMSQAVVRQAAARIAEHASAHDQRWVRVVLHGGEPLLVGPRRLRAIATELRATIEPVAQLDLRMQSNGTQLTPEVCEVLRDCHIAVGISLDGDRASNDRHRRYANRASSYDTVLRALELLRRPAYRHLYAGILCTVDVRNDPIAVYSALMAQDPPRLDFLLPHATWDRPPVRPGSRTPYAAWLLEIFRRWSADGRPVPIRLFDSILATGRGGVSGTESLGLDPADIAVIETDGSWEQADSLKVAFDGAPATGLNVFSHTVDDVAAFPAVAQRLAGLDGLCATCRACPVVRQCGGGLFAHRYRRDNGFDNPSAYCADLKELIVGINDYGSSSTAGAASVREVDDLGLATFEAVGRGYGDAAAIGRLADLQLEIARELVAAVAADAPPGAWQLLLEVERTAPRAVRAVLSHPYVRAWAVDCRRSPAGRIEYLNAIALACAVRGGLEAELPVPVHDTAVYLPTLGRVDLPGPRSTPPVLSTTPGKLHVRDGDHRLTLDLTAPREPWWPSARVDLDGLSLVVEDSDPHRDCHYWPPTGRLDEPARRAWRQSLATAWRIVLADAPEQAAGMTAGLRVVTPLVAAPDGRRRSSYARHAFGAVAVAPTDADALAVLLVHEFQHVKLGALIDIIDFYDPTYPGLITVGWRPEPRPVEMVLHGTYAHLAIADMWRARAERSGDAAAAATFRRYRDWTTEAMANLAATQALTPAGVRLLALMDATIASWR